MDKFSEPNDNLADAMNSLRGWKKIAEAAEKRISALLAERDAFEGAALALRDELRASQAIANEYQQLMYHMDAGGDFFEFQRDKNNG